MSATATPTAPTPATTATASPTSAPSPTPLPSPRFTLEVFVMVDENGDYVVGKDTEDLQALWTDTIGDPPTVSNVYRLDLTVPEPAPIIMRATVPAMPVKPVDLAVTPVS